MNTADRTPTLTHRGALRRLGHGAAGLALAVAVPIMPALAAAPTTDPRLEQALERVRVAWEHIPEQERDVMGACIPIIAATAATVYGGWMPPDEWALA